MTTRIPGVGPTPPPSDSIQVLARQFHDEMQKFIGLGQNLDPSNPDFLKSLATCTLNLQRLSQEAERC